MEAHRAEEFVDAPRETSKPAVLIGIETSKAPLRFVQREARHLLVERVKILHGICNWHEPVIASQVTLEGENKSSKIQQRPYE